MVTKTLQKWLTATRCVILLTQKSHRCGWSGVQGLGAPGSRGSQPLEAHSPLRLRSARRKRVGGAEQGTSALLTCAWPYRLGMRVLDGPSAVWVVQAWLSWASLLLRRRAVTSETLTIFATSGARKTKVKGPV